MAGLWDALKQYIGDALPGGALNPETQPVATRANYLSGMLDPASQVSQDAQAWHKRTQNGLMDQLAGRDTPEAEQAYQTMMQAAGMAPVGMIAWHGSPHKFDKFSLDKIGTGEGAQAYGHGLYLAESPNVAREYAQALDPMAAAARSGIDGEGTAARVLQAVDFNKQRAIDELTRRKNAPHAQGDAEWAAKMDAAIAHIQGTDRTSNLYKTDIPDEAVARFLDWDKPLSQQAPEVQAALHPHISDYVAKKQAEQAAGWGNFNTNSADALLPWATPTGADIHQQLFKKARKELLNANGGRNLGSAAYSEAVAKKLNDLGIPGIRYLDGGSRGTGTGTSNFVAFDPELIRILERNGQPTGLQPWKPGEWKR